VPLPSSETRIPREGFSSWSLFLSCNPTWLGPENKQALAYLYGRYVAFAETSGPDHAAVWFYKDTPDNVDPQASTIYCRKFHLKPSEGPFIVVTTRYPEDLTDRPELVLGFAGLPATTISAMISKLADQVAAQQLSQKDVDSVQYWRSWVHVIEGTCQYLAKVKFTIKVKIAEVERTGVCGDPTS